MIEESDLSALLEADGSETALLCVEAIGRGATVEALSESTALDQHIFWIEKHRDSLSQWNDEESLDEFLEFLMNPSTRSVVLTSVGLDDRAGLPDAYFTVAIDPVQDRVVSCLAMKRTSPRRVVQAT